MAKRKSKSKSVKVSAYKRAANIVHSYYRKKRGK